MELEEIQKLCNGNLEFAKAMKKKLDFAKALKKVQEYVIENNIEDILQLSGWININDSLPTRFEPVLFSDGTMVELGTINIYNSTLTFSERKVLQSAPTKYILANIYHDYLREIFWKSHNENFSNLPIETYINLCSQSFPLNNQKQDES